MRPFLIAAALYVFTVPVLAAGPSVIAAPDRSLWPEAIDSIASFDRASRAEMLVFGQALAASEALDDAALRERLKVKSVNRATVDSIRSDYWNRLSAGYALASAHCEPNDVFCPVVAGHGGFRSVAAEFKLSTPGPYGAWHADAVRFHAVYLNELLRLAALFPRISSEIATFSNSELSGNEPADRHFLLTFDDGPTRAGGNTDKTLAMLRASHVEAAFFMLGAGLETRREQTPPEVLRQAFEGMCVATHGWEHRSHGSWAMWQDSVMRGASLARLTFPAQYVPLFRPPYGQRKADSAGFFTREKLSVALWNIDSQDWNSKVDAHQVKQRVLALMLLWRHGVILFHDIHPKALTAVPWIVGQTRSAGVTWMHCQDWPAAP